MDMCGALADADLGFFQRTFLPVYLFTENNCLENQLKLDPDSGKVVLQTTKLQAKSLSIDNLIIISRVNLPNRIAQITSIKSISQDSCEIIAHTRFNKE